MANKKKIESVNLDDEVQFGEQEETVIETPMGGACGIAIRIAETKDSFRALVTIRFGTKPEKIKFDFGNYGGTVRGGGDGDPPPCP